MLNNDQNHKISSIMTTINKKPTNINIPQSMTIFNLKEISSKFKNFQTANHQNTDNRVQKAVCKLGVTGSSILNVIKNDIKLADNQLVVPQQQPILLQPTLPYHYSDYENLYVCNLCHFTYDSLRSIKAHIWKHSGHSALSYPIIDLNLIKQKKLETICLKPQTSTTTTNATTSTGICSVLLEVIEKLRDEESTTTDTKIVSTSLRKRKLKSVLSCRQLIRKAKIKLRHKIDNKKRKKLIKKLINKHHKEEISKKDRKIEEKECKIETSVLNSLFDDDATILSEQEDYYFNQQNVLDTLSPTSSSSSVNDFQTKNLNSDLFRFLTSLATSDGHDEQYVCGLCSYVCYHLPSLKSHMWSHVKNIQFDYSVNTSIINAALDYENKLNRKLNSIKKANIETDSADTDHNALNRNIFIQRQFNNALELINYPQQQIDKLATYKSNNSSPMVSFRCSSCGFESINLSVLRLHKRTHFK